MHPARGPVLPMSGWKQSLQRLQLRGILKIPLNLLTHRRVSFICYFLASRIHDRESWHCLVSPKTLS